MTDHLLREDKTDKPDFTYVGVMYDAFSRVMNRYSMGAKKYEPLNWRYAKDTLTYKQSLVRHAMQFVNGQTDEDHLAAVVANALILMDLENGNIHQ